MNKVFKYRNGKFLISEGYESIKESEDSSYEDDLTDRLSRSVEPEVDRRRPSSRPPREPTTGPNPFPPQTMLEAESLQHIFRIVMSWIPEKETGRKTLNFERKFLDPLVNWFEASGIKLKQSFFEAFSEESMGNLPDLSRPYPPAGEAATSLTDKEIEKATSAVHGTNLYNHPEAEPKSTPYRSPVKNISPDEEAEILARIKPKSDKERVAKIIPSRIEDEEGEDDEGY